MNNTPMDESEDGAKPLSVSWPTEETASEPIPDGYEPLAPVDYAPLEIWFTQSYKYDEELHTVEVRGRGDTIGYTCKECGASENIPTSSIRAQVLIAAFKCDNMSNSAGVELRGMVFRVSHEDLYISSVDVVEVNESL
jgi:hypothetical protein